MKGKIEIMVSDLHRAYFAKVHGVLMCLLCFMTKPSHYFYEQHPEIVIRTRFLDPVASCEMILTYSAKTMDPSRNSFKDIY